MCIFRSPYLLLEKLQPFLYENHSFWNIANKFEYVPKENIFDEIIKSDNWENYFVFFFIWFGYTSVYEHTLLIYTNSRGSSFTIISQQYKKYHC